VRFDPDSLSTDDWEVVEAIEHVGPAGPWPPEMTSLEKLVAWAGHGLFLAEWGLGPPLDPID
jgi:hypothetical protein